MANPPVRLLNFISEQEVEEIRKKRGDKSETESTVPDRPLFEILKENKDKQQSEFNERFKHQPPKALDDDETEFLESLEKYKKEQELQLANEEAQQLLSFQLAVASRTTVTEEPTSSFHQSKEVPVLQKEKRPAPVRSFLSTIKIRPQPKKAKVEDTSLSWKEQHQPVLMSETTKPSSMQAELEATKSQQTSNPAVVTRLVAYGTDSEEDELSG